MAQFGGFDDNWGLQAIVRGSTSTFSAGGGGLEYSGYGDLDLQINDDNNGFLFGEDNLFQSHQVAMLTDDDFQQLYKPFYPVWDSSSSSPAHDHQHNPPPTSIINEIKLHESDVVLHRNQLISPPDQSTDGTTAVAQQTPKYKRRKNQQKRVVVQAAEGVPSDMWAWRKYGQKPIKGSPYPRSYYRCSSSKSCLAKKQVEQSCTEPGVNIITYTAEHNHSQPIRKNALAGTTRQKFPTQISQAARTNCNKAAESKENSSNSNCSSLPGSTSADVQVASINEDGCSVKQEGKEEIMSSDIKMEEEFFAGLEDLDGLISELVGGQQQYSSKMFSMNFYNY